MRRREARHEVGAKRQRSSHALKAGREASDEATQTHTAITRTHTHRRGIHFRDFCFRSEASAFDRSFARFACSTLAQLVLRLGLTYLCS